MADINFSATQQTKTVAFGTSQGAMPRGRFCMTKSIKKKVPNKILKKRKLTQESTQMVTFYFTHIQKSKKFIKKIHVTKKY